MRQGKRVKKMEKRGKPRIKALREENNLTQTELAEIVGVTKTTVSRWETGNIATLKMNFLDILSKRFQVNPAWILGYDVQRKILSKEGETTKAELERAIRLMDEEQLRKTLSFVNEYIIK